MIFDCFYDITLSVQLKHLFGNESVTVVEWDVEVAKITVRSIEISWVTESTLVVRYGPSWSCHNSKVVISVSVD